MWRTTIKLKHFILNINKLAETLDLAAFHAKPVGQLSHHTKFTVDEAYDIQAASMERRYERGEKFIGLKMGFTSKAKMVQMGIHDMIWGRLTDAMLLEKGQPLLLEKFIHPRAEPEICFLVKKEIVSAVSLEEAPEYIAGVAAAIEIIDSRYENFKFTLEDVIADNCSSAALVIGEWHDPTLPIGDLKIDLEIDGEIVETGSSAAILGNPWESVEAAARLAKQYGQTIPAGSVIMAGAATSAVFLKKENIVKAVVEGLGSLEFVVK